MLADIIKNIAVVGGGSFIGGAARYLVSLAMKDVSNGFPWATMAVSVFAGVALVALGYYLAR